MEVIFISGDKTQEEYDTYFEDMPWLALPRGDKRLPVIAKKYEAKGVPRLVMVKIDGTVLDPSAIKKVVEEGPQAVEDWLRA
jgi:nucleoredoxin